MIKGYKNLSESDKQLFTVFCENYKAANSSDVEIEFITVKREKDYLRVDLLRNGRKTWQQVFSPTSWG